MRGDDHQQFGVFSYVSLEEACERGAGPTIQYRENHRAPMNSYEAFFPPISAEAQKRIRAGLLEIEALWHAPSHHNELTFFAPKRYLGLAYDVFAQEILSEVDCTD